MVEALLKLVLQPRFDTFDKEMDPSPEKVVDLMPMAHRLRLHWHLSPLFGKRALSQFPQVFLNPLVRRQPRQRQLLQQGKVVQVFLAFKLFNGLKFYQKPSHMSN